MKDFVKSLGGAGWATFGGLSIILSVVAAIGLPYVVDTSNPWVLLFAGAILFIVAFANGWKQRGFRNERDIRLADELEKARIAEKEKNEVAIARIQADKELELERMRQEREGRKELERKADEAVAEEQRRLAASKMEDRRALLQFQSLSVEQLRAVGILYRSREPVSGLSDYTTMMALREAGVAFTPASQYRPDGNSRWVLKPEWRQLIAGHVDLFEQVLVENDLMDIMVDVGR